MRNEWDTGGEEERERLEIDDETERPDCRGSAIDSLAPIRRAGREGGSCRARSQARERQRGIRTRCPPELLLRRRNPAEHAAAGSMTDRPPARWAGHPLAGIPGYERLRAGISRPIRVRDLRGMCERPAVERRQKIPICRYFSGSDGTRTRDLRRDRPLPGSRHGRRWAPDRSVHAVSRLYLAAHRMVEP